MLALSYYIWDLSSYKYKRFIQAVNLQNNYVIKDY